MLNFAAKAGDRARIRDMAAYSQSCTKVAIWKPCLRILMSGKLAAKCDDTFLHFVQPFEFINSIEWRSAAEQKKCSEGEDQGQVILGSGGDETKKTAKRGDRKVKYQVRLARKKSGNLLLL
jgi:hypothetical protein